MRCYRVPLCEWAEHERSRMGEQSVFFLRITDSVAYNRVHNEIQKSHLPKHWWIYCQTQTPRSIKQKTSAEGTEQVAQTRIEAGHLSKIVTFTPHFGAKNFIQSAKSYILLIKKQKQEGIEKNWDKSLIKCTKQSVQLIQAKPFRRAWKWAHATRVLHWLARQPVAMATWRWRRAEWERWVASNGGDRKEDASAHLLL